MNFITRSFQRLAPHRWMESEGPMLHGLALFLCKCAVCDFAVLNINDILLVSYSYFQKDFSEI